jgi:hypothetical protein
MRQDLNTRISSTDNEAAGAIIDCEHTAYQSSISRQFVYLKANLLPYQPYIACRKQPKINKLRLIWDDSQGPLPFLVSRLNHSCSPRLWNMALRCSAYVMFSLGE